MTRRQLTLLTALPGPDGVVAATAAVRNLLAGGPPFAIAQPGTAAAFEAHAPLRRADIGAVVATSGSTAEPLAVLLTTEALLASARLGQEALGGPGLWLTAVPVTGIGGLLTVVRSVLAGVDPVAWRGVGGAAPFTAESFADDAVAAQAKATAAGLPCYVALVPTQVVRLVRGGRCDLLTGFRAVLVGGAALPDEVREQAEAAGVRLVTTYGATETGGGVVYDGRPLPGVTVEIEADGTIVMGGPTIAAGYRLRPDLDAARLGDARFRTCDLGELRDGRLILLGRTDDIIKVGGVKVSLHAIENALLSHPRVLDAAVSGEPDDEWGCVPVAQVVPDQMPGPHDDTLATALVADLQAFVTGRLGRAAAPRRIELLHHLPVGGTGKTRRRG